MLTATVRRLLTFTRLSANTAPPPTSQKSPHDQLADTTQGLPSETRVEACRPASNCPCSICAATGGESLPWFAQYPQQEATDIAVKHLSDIVVSLTKAEEHYFWLIATYNKVDFQIRQYSQHLRETASPEYHILLSNLHRVEANLLYNARSQLGHGSHSPFLPMVAPEA
ncbi:hypothetical protein NMY22_g9064 [Coprinellus aureogranulatus]|nr:hypothetical protein NMY22_g9064 [Coprinellus aureogranulatus]